MAIIAFVYADIKRELVPIYRPLAEGLVQNIRSVMPGVSILHVTDDFTPVFSGCNTLRVPRKVPPMSWRLVAQNLAHAAEDEILFTEPDVRFNENVMDLFKEDFDVTVSDREKPTILKGKIVKGITLGLNCSRSYDFWKDAAKHCLTLDHKEQVWGGDMYAVEHVVNSGKYKVLTLPAGIYNHVPCGPEDKSGKVLHYKGNRKTWLFPAMEEVC